MLVRSRARNWLERMRREHTSLCVYRCDQCGWRGWLNIIEYFGGHGESRLDSNLDLEVIDARLAPRERDKERGQPAPRRRKRRARRHSGHA
jgi:hypothetical protein